MRLSIKNTACHSTMKFRPLSRALTMEQSPLIAHLRARWTQSPYPMIVDHRRGGRICPAPTLYMGSRHWAARYTARGRRAGDQIAIDPEPSAETIMRVLGALRIGAQAVMGPAQDSLPADAPRRRAYPAAMRFALGPDLTEATIVERLQNGRSVAVGAYPTRGSWQHSRTWLEEIWPALSDNQEVHLNVDAPACPSLSEGRPPLAGQKSADRRVYGVRLWSADVETDVDAENLQHTGRVNIALRDFG